MLGSQGVSAGWMACLGMAFLMPCGAQNASNGCKMTVALLVQPAAGGSSEASAANYLASFIPTPIPTPGIQNSLGGTAAVRIASDSSLTAKPGSGEGLNQARVAPNGVSATPSGTFTQFSFVDVPNSAPSVSPLPLGETVQSYKNNLCNSTGTLTPHEHDLSARSKLPPATASATASGSYAILGSQNVAIAALSNGNQVVGWLDNDSTALHTAIRSADGSTLTTGADYRVGP